MLHKDLTEQVEPIEMKITLELAQFNDAAGASNPCDSQPSPAGENLLLKKTLAASTAHWPVW